MGKQVLSNTTERIWVVARNASGGLLTGLTDVLLSIRRKSDGFYLDFNDLTFKSSGWTTKQQQMTETEPISGQGQYHYDFNSTPYSDDEFTMSISSTTARNLQNSTNDELTVGGFFVSSAAGGPVVVITDNTELRVGSLRAKTFLFKDDNGDAFDLSGFSVLTMRMEAINDPTDKLKFNTDDASPILVITDAVGGVAVLTPIVGTFTNAVAYKSYFDADGESLPDNKELQLSVRPKIDDP